MPFATRRFLILFFLGTWPLVLSVLVPELLMLGLGFDAFLLLLFLSDWWAAPGPKRLLVTRRADRLWFQGTERPVTLSLENRGAASCEIELEDRLPDALVGEGARAVVRLLGGARFETEYRARAIRRGLDRWQGIALRARGPLGLGGRSWFAADATECEVLPDARVHGRLPLGARGRTGARSRPRSLWVPERGEFDRLRDYVLGDDPRTIDWKATARRAKPVTRQYVSPRHQQIVIAVDCGRWMGAPAGELTRLDRAAGAAAALATAAISAGDRVGLILFDREVRRARAPGEGRDHLRRLIRDLTELEASAIESLPERALVAAGRLVRRRALLVLLTDLSDPRRAPRLAEALRRLQPHFLSLCVTSEERLVKCWAEEEPRDVRQAYRRVVAGDVLDEQERARQRLRRSGVLTVFGPADQLTSQLLETYTRVKRRTLL